MAYMLATTFIESSSTVKVKLTSKNKQGHVVVRTAKVWRNFAPVEEKGHGRTHRYGPPVKVKPLDNGSVRVTEWDGDQWIVSPDAHQHRVDSTHGLGATPGDDASAAYRRDSGEEKHYFGRGFVQLTWWSNYAEAGVLIGQGLDLLLDPDSVDEPELAYRIISTGMRTGRGFAHGHTFREFFHGQHTDYVHARKMVNGMHHAQEIGQLAERFEQVLRASSSSTTPPAKL
jgi:hypothetical protein